MSDTEKNQQSGQSGQDQLGQSGQKSGRNPPAQHGQNPGQGQQKQQDPSKKNQGVDEEDDLQKRRAS